MSRKTKFLLFFAVLFAGPIYAALSGVVSYGKDWRTADRQSTGIAPLAKLNPEAIIQVYSARAFNWRGVFGVHTWIATKEKNAQQYKTHQVVGWNLYRNISAVVSKADAPDRSWYGYTPNIIRDIRGKQAEELIPKVQSAVNNYPYDFTYHVWPGPNSNTFTAYVARQVPELNLQLPATAIGKDYLPNNRFIDQTPSGTGYQMSLFGVIGISAAKTEGLEFNVLGLNFGIDFDQTAVILPGLDRIGG